MDKAKIEKSVKIILAALGENPDREGLKDTPKRIAEMYEEIFSGLKEDPEKHLQTTFQEDQHEELILQKDLPFYSFCEHHFIPFFGKAHIGYIPDQGKIVGLSKLARVLDGFAKRPQLQERLTSNVADTIFKKLKPKGVIVVLEAEHMCITMRGIKKPGSTTVTSALRGIFNQNAKTRAEVLSLIMARR